MMNLASIDIGSNGARLLIKRFDPEAIREEDRIKNSCSSASHCDWVRMYSPWGKVSKEREKMMLHMMKGFKQFMKLNDVEAFRACATSAMRDAENGKKVLKKIEKQTGIKLEIIKGQEEAQLLYNNLVEKTDSNEGSFAYIDVGGGSTEVSIIHDGVLAESYSYNMGTLRMLSGKVTAETEKALQGEPDEICRAIRRHQDHRFGWQHQQVEQAGTPQQAGLQNLTLAELEASPHSMMQPLSIEEREISFSLKEDRADVIIPAAEIFLKACEYLKCENIMVPNISLADSIVDGLYEKMMAKTEE